MPVYFEKSIEKANTFEIDEIYLCQIQSYSAPATPYPGFHLIKALSS